MKRLFRRAIVALLVVIVGLVIAGLIVRARVLAKPTWYVRPALDEQTLAAVANNMDQKLIGTWTAARDAQMAETRARHANPQAPPTTAPAEPIVLTATEDEINASFNKWKSTAGWNRDAGKYLKDPALVLEDHSIILAATVSLKGIDAVVSLHFTPRLEGEKLALGFSKVMVGTLPVPRSYYGGQVQKVTDAMEDKLPELREEADIGPRGWANEAAVGAAMGDLLMGALQDRPVEPAVFLPEPKVGNDKRYLPVRIIGIDISEKTLTLTLLPMNADQREALLGRIKGK